MLNRPTDPLPACSELNPALQRQSVVLRSPKALPTTATTLVKAIGNVQASAVAVDDTKVYWIDDSILYAKPR